MLLELYVKNLAVIEELRLAFRNGLTILSGDEGAGKSLLVDALSLLLGGRASPALIRAGSPGTLVEGVFSLDEADDGVRSALAEAGLEPEPDGTLILVREVQEQGRSIARVNGRAVPASVLKTLRLMDIHSQMEHLSLLQQERQLGLLDEFAGLKDERRRFAGKVVVLRERIRSLKMPSEDARRKRELLEYQVSEIEQAKLQPGEDKSLQQEAEVLRRAEAIKEACSEAYQALFGDDLSAIPLAERAMKTIRAIANIDQYLQQRLAAIEGAAAELAEAARDLRHFAETVESRAERLQEVEERLELLRRLKGKYGQTIEEVIDFGQRAARELQAIQDGEEHRARLAAEVRCLQEEAGQLADALSERRAVAARDLAKRVNQELAELGIGSARFDIGITREEEPDGLSAKEGVFAYDESGIDRVGFLAATNPGEPLKPLTAIASGGETCRFMLAVKSALRKADSIGTLVFDEIDAGIGGRRAESVGRKLATLGLDRQVIAITHLPQIACFGQSHYRLVKEIANERAFTRAEELTGETREEEIAAMLGGQEKARAMMQSARELLKQARGPKRLFP